MSLIKSNSSANPIITTDDLFKIYTGSIDYSSGNVTYATNSEILASGSYGSLWTSDIHISTGVAEDLWNMHGLRIDNVRQAFTTLESNDLSGPRTRDFREIQEQLAATPNDLNLTIVLPDTFSLDYP